MDKHPQRSEAEAYLQSLSAELGNLPEQQRRAILDEIESHIEAAAEASPDGSVSLRQQLGDPTALAYGMQQAYRPKRWVDLLLALIATLAIFPALFALLSLWFEIEQVIRFQQLLGVLLFLPFVAFSIKRPAPELRLFLLSTGLMMTLEAALKNPATMGPQWEMSWVDTGLFVILAFGLGALLHRAIQTVRYDSLLTTWAWLPIAAKISSVIGFVIVPRLHSVTTYGEATLRSTIISLALTPIILGLFFLATRRRYRWLGLIGFVTLEIIIVTLFYAPVNLLHPAYFAQLLMLGLPLALGLWRERAFINEWHLAT